MAKRRGQLKAVLSPEARRDLRDTLRWSETKFGPDAALRYEALLVQVLRDIESDPARPGSTERPEIMIKGARTYHIRFSRGRAKITLGIVHDPRHFILYRLREGLDVIDIGRILPDGRDLQRHLPEQYRRVDTASSRTSRREPWGRLSIWSPVCKTNSRGIQRPSLRYWPSTTTRESAENFL
ncbi:MAG: type II toxin-antitoxin system RelE/ParE family toxin [Bryobacteraceae bacterium]